jgi:hypothetical protein
MFDLRVVEDAAMNVKGLVENGYVSDLLNVESDIAVIRRNPLKLTCLKTSTVTHIGSPNDVQFPY